MKTNTWNIDPQHSSIAFSVRHMVFAKVHGRFDSWLGAIRVDGEDLAGATVDVEIDASSINTGTADRDKHLRSPDFLDVERFPTLNFRSTLVEKKGERYRVHGELTIRGVTRTVVLDAKLGGQANDPWGNRRIAFEASTSIDRGDYGLKWNQVLEAGGLLVGERIDIELEVQAVQAAATEAA